MKKKEAHVIVVSFLSESPTKSFTTAIGRVIALTSDCFPTNMAVVVRENNQNDVSQKPVLHKLRT